MIEMRNFMIRSLVFEPNLKLHLQIDLKRIDAGQSQSLLFQVFLVPLSSRQSAKNLRLSMQRVTCLVTYFPICYCCEYDSTNSSMTTLRREETLAQAVILCVCGQAFLLNPNFQHHFRRTSSHRR